MTPRELEFHPSAIAEARAARRWYASRSHPATLRFMEELDRAISQIMTAPGQSAPYLHGTRFRKIRRFPFLVIFRETGATIQVLAIARAKRRPGYWKRRSLP